MNIVAMRHYPGYNAAERMVSELSAIGAPSREVWVRMGYLYSTLMFAFSFGAWLTARAERRLRAAAVALFLYALVGILWPPMHMRGAELTLTDTLHIVATFVTVALIFAAVVLSWNSFGEAFHWYSVATVICMLGFGLSAAKGGADVAKGLPTPLLGVWQRINMGALFLWIAVFAGALWRNPRVGSKLRFAQAIPDGP